MNLVPDFSEAAEWDLAEIVAYFDERSDSVSDRFRQGVEKTVRMLCWAPESGTACLFQNPAYADVRVTTIIGYSNYILFFRRLENSLQIVRIVHGARDYDKFFD